MDESTATGRLIATLKQEFKAKGLHYRDIASRLDVSEGTVKRYFGGKGLSLQALEQLAHLVDHDLLSLAALTEQRETTPSRLTREQLAGLRGSKVTLAVFYFLALGFTPAQLAREFDLTNQIDRILHKLQTLGLIRRLSNDKIKLLAKPGGSGFSWEVDSDVRHRKVKYAREFLDEFNLDDARCNWMDLSARLSADSIVHLRESIQRFAGDVQSLTKKDLALPPGQTQWYRLFVGAEPVSRQRIFRPK